VSPCGAACTVRGVVLGGVGRCGVHSALRACGVVGVRWCGQGDVFPMIMVRRGYACVVLFVGCLQHD
jgi:hypothetical protein